MNNRRKNKGVYICRRLRNTDMTFSIKVSYRLAYFCMSGKRAYIVKKRGTNNVIEVFKRKSQASNFLKFMNNKKRKSSYVEWN